MKTIFKDLVNKHAQHSTKQLFCAHSGLLLGSDLRREFRIRRWKEKKAFKNKSVRNYYYLSAQCALNAFQIDAVKVWNKLWKSSIHFTCPIVQFETKNTRSIKYFASHYLLVLKNAMKLGSLCLLLSFFYSTITLHLAHKDKQKYHWIHIQSIVNKLSRNLMYRSHPLRHSNRP